MAGIAPYQASLQAGGFTASSAPNTTTHNVNVASSTAAAPNGVLHMAVAAVVVGIIILAIGRGWLSNARIG